MKENKLKNFLFLNHLTFFVLILTMTLGIQGCFSTQDQPSPTPDQVSTQETPVISNPSPEQTLDQTSLSTPMEENKIVPGNVPPIGKGIMMRYIVQHGDSLIKISRKIYGNKSSMSQLVQWNNIVDENRIYTGDVIMYELTQSSYNFCSSYENTPKAKIVVKKGDNLSIISQAVFGTPAGWRTLWIENQGQIKNPDKIKIGQEITFRPKSLLTIEKVSSLQHRMSVS